MSNPGTMLECDICLKRFPDAALLSVHQWMHAGSSSNPPRATVNVLCEPDPFIKPEGIKEELVDINEQEDGGKEKCEMAQTLNKNGQTQDLIKCEDIKWEVEDTNKDALNDQLLLDDSESFASGRDIENQMFINTCMSALIQQHSRKVQQVNAPRPERIKHQCDQCSYTTYFTWSLKDHKSRKHGGARYPCDQCDYSAAKPNTLKQHKASKHEGVRYQCDFCDYAATTLGALKTHKASKHDKIRYPCDQCDFSVTRKSDLKRHKALKHEEHRYPCDQCIYVTKTLANLKQHKASAHEGVRYLCDQCDYSATQSSNLNKHRNSKHKVTTSK